MNQKTTDTTLFLNKCFYLCFHTQEEYKVDIKKFITSSGDKLTFNFFGFIDNLKSQKETYGLIPIDVFYDDYCTKDILQKIKESFELDNYVLKHDEHYVCPKCMGDIWD